MSKASSAAHQPHRHWDILQPTQQTAPVVFASPHSGSRYPEAFVKGSPLSRLALRRSEDSFVDALFAAAPDHGAPMLRAHFPRAFVDVNREPFELDPAMFADALPDFVNTQSSRVAAGLGTIAKVVSNGQEIYREKLQFADAYDRIKTYYRPYHRALRTLIDQTLRDFGHCVLIDCHSMPSIGGPLDPDAGRGRADFVLGDCFGAACADIVTSTVESALRSQGHVVVRNKPFAGGFTTRNYGRPREGLHAMQIEINRGLYMDERRIRPNDGFERLAAQMTDVVRAVTELGKMDLAAE